MNCAKNVGLTGRKRSHGRFEFGSVLLALFLISIALSGLGCASFGKKLKAFMAGRGGQGLAAEEVPALSTPRFSEQDNVRYSSERKYRRMTKNKFEEEAEIGAGAGSLWVMEGQNAYLFSQNTSRLVGDILNVRIQGNPKAQLGTKTRVIARLLERLEAPSVRAPSGVAGSAVQGALPGGAQDRRQAGQQSQAGSQDQQGRAAGAAAENTAGASPIAGSAGDPQGGTNGVSFAVEKVPTRIVEVLKEGTYRVKGAQEFMIGKREYKVIVTGLVRPEDFNEDGIDSEKLLDARFDIVSNRRGSAL